MKREQRIARPRAAGFTLVELLVVITIIGVLVSLISLAVVQGLKKAEQAKMYTEITSMHGAVETFKNQFEDYPPDGSGGMERLRKFSKKAFPSANLGGAKGGMMPTDITDPQTGPGKALVFWLSELNKDKRNPFKREGSAMGGAQTKDEYKQIFFTFDESRIRNGMYFPSGYDVQNDPPYVYFNKDTYPRATFQFQGNSLRPYNKGQAANQSGRSGSSGNNMDYFSAESFQIIAAGRDRRLGTGGTLSMDGGQTAGSGMMVSQDDEDNMVNFDTRMVGDIK